ncbi:MAG: hypothetical protein L6R38_004555 [Xanthoria sp. 2 TBL-2021]|nr:MAG: hypothetical protein L6R38_004555 [Xanthoria sp. 2 TBL-2021]
MDMATIAPTLDRFFHVSPTLFPPPHEGAERQNFFEQLEPLSENPGFLFKRYWERGIHVAVDETIQRFTGRTEETVNIPSKPVPEGFKIRNRPVDLDNHWLKELGFSKTPAVILDLLAQDNLSPEDACVVWLDNLFTEAILLSAVRDRGIGAAETQREEEGESRGTKAQRKKAKSEPNKGLIPSLNELGLVHKSQIKWVKLYGALSKDGKVVELPGRTRM